VRLTTLFRGLLGVEKTTVIERIEYDEDQEAVVAHVHVTGRLRPRCGACGARAPRYDGGEGRRRWRALDLGAVPVHLEAEAPRVCCAEHGVTVAWVPWARHGAGLARYCLMMRIVSLLYDFGFNFFRSNCSVGLGSADSVSIRRAVRWNIPVVAMISLKIQPPGVYHHVKLCGKITRFEQW
jgi:hypothetical protein